MFGKSILGIAIVLWLAALSVGQQFFAPVGGYYAPSASQPQIQPLPAPGATVPAQYTVPSTPYATPYPASSQGGYPAPSSVPYPIPYTAPYAPTYPAAQPAPLEVMDVPAEPQPAAAPTEAATPAAEPPADGEAAVEEPALPEEETPKAWYYPPLFWFDLWEGSVELGLSGSDGNSETLNYLLGVDAKRETDEHILNFDLRYDRKSANSIETAHRLFSEVRWELLFEDSAWTWFFHETTEYDEFKDFDVRLSYDTGLGRCLIKNDMTSLLARAGAGTSHEVGGSNEDFVPEAVFGLEFKHKLNQRQKVSASSEYSPDVTDFLDYRLKSKASWEVLLDEKTNLSLKVSLLDRYDSTPNGKKANDLDYTLTLLWNF